MLFVEDQKMEPKKAQTEVHELNLLDFSDGSDELNLAEFPLSVISQRRGDDDAKVRTFSDEIFDKAIGQTVKRTVTIAGSADYGLPNSTDEEVLLALIQFTKRERFSSKRVFFSRYDLLRLLGWEDTGYYYNRLKRALATWLGVTVKWEKAWRNYTSDKASWADKGFLKGITLIQDCELRTQSSLTADCYFTWSEEFWGSLRSGNLKGLDFGIYRGLSAGIAKRMFRFLDKRFYTSSKLTFDLAVFAYEKIGISRSCSIYNAKQNLQPAIDELERLGFLAALPREERFRKRRKGEWEVVFQSGKADRQQVQLELEVDAVPPLEEALVQKGVTRNKAKTLVAQYPKELIEEKLGVLDYLMGMGKERHPKSPAGYLVKSITENYGNPSDYKTPSRVVQDEQQEAVKVQAREEARAKQKVAQKRAEELERAKQDVETKRVADYLAKLGPDDRKALEQEALRSSPLGSGSISEIRRRALIHNHALRLLDDKQTQLPL